MIYEYYMDKVLEETNTEHGTMSDGNDQKRPSLLDVDVDALIAKIEKEGIVIKTDARSRAIAATMHVIEEEYATLEQYSDASKCRLSRTASDRIVVDHTTMDHSAMDH